MTSPADRAPPALADALRALADEGSVERAAVRLGLSSEQLARFLREQADTLAWSSTAIAQRMAAAPKPVPAPAPAPRPAPAPAPAAAPGRRAVLYSDGASRGNPGPAGAGAVLVLPDGQRVNLGRFLGVQTNNVAEYQGVILGLEKALELGLREVDVRADSMLAMMQLKGEWKLKNEGLKPLFDRARTLARQFDRITFQHIPREQNGDADEMSNRAIDERMP